ncbi:von Willebrand factor A domain-containing protein 7-like isoform X2 [Heterodontus francisci]
MAALRITLKVFQGIPSPDGKVLPADAFQPEGRNLTAEKLFEAYYGMDVSVSRFKQALSIITFSNTKVDFQYVFEEKRHFDSETLLEAKEVLLSLKASVIQNILQGMYTRALKNLGTMLHTLQDFYSHSNWIELGYRIPHSNLIKPGATIGTIAEKTQRTCTECSSSRSCNDKILENIIQEKILTTGYFGLNPHSKPKGKCSHGGSADLTRQGTQGINKDTVSSPHAQYHTEAAQVATEASLEVFQDIWDTVGDEAFLRFLHIDSPSGLSFVIDTTGSMKNDIEAAKQRTINIVKNRRGKWAEPAFYVLVPFSDPGFGPVYKTSDPDKFIEQLRLLKAEGGGDIPEMSLSALRLALTNTPPLSYIYVFTDAPAKDHELKDTVTALIEQTKCKVSFLLTNALNRRRRDTEDRFGNPLYQLLARVSGGLAVTIRRELIPQLTSIIEDSATPALVTVLQRDNNPAYPENSFTFPVDPSLQNITIYISGNPANFKISSPRDMVQISTENFGKLGLVERLGDLIIIRLHSTTDIGEWELVVSSGTPYNVKVTGQSVVDFMYDFTESFEGPHPGLTLLPGRPLAGKESVLVVTVAGLPLYPFLILQEVALVDLQGEALRKEPLKTTASPDTFLVEFDTLPDRGFYVQLSGRDGNNLKFRRQSSTLNTVTNTAVKVIAKDTVKVGMNTNISYTITNKGSPSLYKIHTTDDHNFTQSQPSSVFINSNQTIEGTSIVSAPDGTEPGTVVTVTVEARSPLDLGYSVHELTVISQVQDLTPPTCGITARSKQCPPGGQAQCGLKLWSLTARFTNSGMDKVAIYARRGNGTFTREEKQGGVTLVHYTSSCCFPDVDLVGVDTAGNAGRCSTRVNNRGQSSAAYNMAALVATSLLSCLLG